ncbi:hypothetical protein K0M31_012569 [Melipona bicolor]|uniref:Fatty acyl-CoA reductase n=1 Tax=Melipona bicolor TaxID=60889 RepID=A0AA40KH67_9HYME|nr:hypothetical protein K0M31_012569 [Melipona bicolor]
MLANSMKPFYDNTAILVTGFVGKGILEKLMLVCPSIAAIYILIRPKKDQTIKQRLKKLIDDPGDVSLPDLDLSPANRTILIENVIIVFHVVATNFCPTVVIDYRHSIIAASLEEPCPGWVDNIYGVTGTLIDNY